ncbi:UNVERIFIED_CONTAM: hypothetical protein GTU68_057233 [Idotea baltica]|nr:hypothetical protein [Idotea baltica]
MIHTSGTTGPPKGVVLTHGNIQSQVQSINTAWELTSNDVLLHCLPLNHVHGIVNALLCPLYCGAKVVMEPHFSASSVWSKLLNLNPEVSSRVNLLMAVPTIYAKLIDEYETSFVNDNRRREFVKKVCVENVRLMVSGSAPLPEPLLQKWRQITGHTLLERYGMTEIGMALTNPLKGERIPGFVGKPFPGVRVKVARFSPKRDAYETLCEGTHEGTSVAPGFKGEAGELLVKGPNVFREYWQREEATKKEFTKDGWFCTGDTAAYIDGSYKILGRTSVDIIKSGGFKVSALDVERQLLSHPGIVDVAVVGVPDMTWGEKIGCVVVWKGEAVLDLATLREWAKERLPHYQVPSALKVLPDALPRNNMGKVNKKELLKQYFKKT